MCTFDTVAKIHFSLSILLLSFLWFLRRFEIEPGFVKFCTLCRKLHYWDILVIICIGTKKKNFKFVDASIIKTLTSV